MAPKKILNKINEIYVSKDFKHLDYFKAAKTWSGLNEKERQLLARIFVMRGAEQLKEGSDNFKESFRIAEKICARSPAILYRQACALAEQKHSRYCLKAAIKLFNRVLGLRSDIFEAWHGLGVALSTLGRLDQDSGLLQKAVEKFGKAEALLDGDRARCARFYRDFALVWYYLGKASKEACDYNYSIRMFKLAEELGSDTRDFWNDYGKALFQLALLINRENLYLEAVSRFSKAVEIDGGFYEGWINLGGSLRAYSHMDVTDRRLVLSLQAYEEAANLRPEVAASWIEWGKTLLFRGRIFKDLESLRKSLEKFEVAELIEPRNPEALSLWGETHFLLGVRLERLDHFKEALKKFKQSIEIQKDSPDNWGKYGCCLDELGRYFHDPHYHYQAIEIFKRGLKISPENILLLHNLALSYFSLGMVRKERKWLEKSNCCFRKLMKKEGRDYAHYWNDWGLLLMRLTDFTDDKNHILQAIEKFEEAIRMVSTCSEGGIPAEYLFNWGLALDNLGDFEDDSLYYRKSYLALEKVLGVSPSYPNIHYHLALSYAHYADMASDIEYFNKALRHMEICHHQDPENDVILCDWGEILINLAELVYDSTFPGMAEKYFREAEERLIKAASLGNNLALFYLACVYALTGNLSLAMFYLEKSYQRIDEFDFIDILQDEWLDPLREMPEFKQFINNICDDQN